MGAYGAGLLDLRCLRQRGLLRVNGCGSPRDYVARDDALPTNQVTARAEGPWQSTLQKTLEKALV